MGADPPKTPEQTPSPGQANSQSNTPAAAPKPAQPAAAKPAQSRPSVPSGAKQAQSSQAQPKAGAPNRSRPQTGQQRAPSSGQRDPTKPKYGEGKSRAGEYMSMPFVFISFMFGLINMLAVPVIYVYEIIKNNEKDEWPAWSGLDGLNYLFFSKNPLFIRDDMLYHLDPQRLPVRALDLHIAELTKYVNTFACGYLNMAVAFVCLLQGAIFMWLAVRIAIRALDKPAKPAK